MHTEDQHTYQAPQKNKVTQAFLEYGEMTLKLFTNALFTLLLILSVILCENSSPLILPFVAGSLTVNIEEHLRSEIISGPFWSGIICGAVNI